MSEIEKFLELVKKVVNIKHKDSYKSGFSTVFKFPQTNDYIDWVEDRLRTLPTYGERWFDFYWDIIEQQIRPTGNIIPSLWNISYPTNCGYVIADENEKVLYVGKSEYAVIVRILDRMIPKYSDKYPNGQKLNNIPQIWDDILSKGHHVNCFYCYDLNFDPGLLEYFLLYEYRNKNDRLPMYNKRMPNSKFLSETLELRNLLSMT